mgnify:CR=1 FL=1
MSMSVFFIPYIARFIACPNPNKIMTFKPLNHQEHFMTGCVIFCHFVALICQDRTGHRGCDCVDSGVTIFSGLLITLQMNYIAAKQYNFHSML